MRTVWLASYPKSGNTWFRMLLANLAAGDAPADINAMEDRAIASGRVPFDQTLLIESGLLRFDEIDGLRPLLHIALARDETGDAAPAASGRTVRFVKVHDAYTTTPAGEALLGGARGADAAILIVRDPRDVAPSLAGHLRGTVDDAITFMNDGGAGLALKRDRQHQQLPQRLLGWSGFQQSWLAQTDLPLHVLRYEDLQRDPAGCFAAALAFAGQPAADADIARAAGFSSFAQLRAQEQAGGFAEAPLRPGGPFFRRGESGGWRDELTAEQVARVEAAHAPMMARLGYRRAAAAVALTA